MKQSARCLVALVLSFALSLAIAEPNRKLQIHFMDVGQDDGAVLLSPQGEVVMVDSSNSKACGKPLGYLESIGITAVVDP